MPHRVESDGMMDGFPAGNSRQSNADGQANASGHINAHGLPGLSEALELYLGNQSNYVETRGDRDGFPRRTYYAVSANHTETLDNGEEYPLGIRISHFQSWGVRDVPPDIRNQLHVNGLAFDGDSNLPFGETLSRPVTGREQRTGAQNGVLPVNAAVARNAGRDRPAGRLPRQNGVPGRPYSPPGNGGFARNASNGYSANR